jgi:hypothetical protein
MLLPQFTFVLCTSAKDISDDEKSDLSHKFITTLKGFIVETNFASMDKTRLKVAGIENTL